MLYSIKNIESLEEIEELASLQNQVEEIRLQEKLGKQYIQENTKKYLNHLLIQSKIAPRI